MVHWSPLTASVSVARAPVKPVAVTPVSLVPALKSSRRVKGITGSSVQGEVLGAGADAVGRRPDQRVAAGRVADGVPLMTPVDAFSVRPRVVSAADEVGEVGSMP